MKKLLICLFLVLFSVSHALATGTVTQSRTVYNEGVIVVALSCTGDSSNGSIPDTAVSTTYTNHLASQGFYLYKVRSRYGATGPTDDSDIYLLDANSIDVLGGAGVDMLDNATNNEFYPKIGTSNAVQPVLGTLTLDVNNQAVHSATYTIELFFVK